MIKNRDSRTILSAKLRAMVKNDNPDNQAWELSMPPELAVEPISLPEDFAVRFCKQSTYQLADFLCLDDETFLLLAYRVILKRAPDKDGGTHYGTVLKSGKPREDILFSLRRSPEGKEVGVSIKGLRRGVLSRRLCNLPLLGRIVEWFLLLLTLPAVKRRLDNVEANRTATLLRAESEREEIVGQLLANQSRLQARIQLLEETMSGRTSRGRGDTNGRGS